MVNPDNLKPEVVIDYTCLLGEGPVWDWKRKVICWIDILRGHVHQYSPEDKTHTTISVNDMIGCMAISTDGNIIAALKSGLAFIDRETKKIRIIADPEDHLPGNRFNDGKCDPAGRFWAGTMALSEEPQAGSVYVLDKDLTFSKKIEGVTISNGMAWSPDQKTFYYIDTPTYTIVSYQYEKTTGAISNKKAIIIFDRDHGYPDGMTIDAEGMLWIAHWDGWQITRWNPNTGKKLFSIPLPVARVTSCAFGGDNMDDLYITTARKELTEEQLKDQPLAGSLFVLHKCGVKGIPAFEFQLSTF